MFRSPDMNWVCGERRVGCLAVSTSLLIPHFNHPAPSPHLCFVFYYSALEARPQETWSDLSAGQRFEQGGGGIGNDHSLRPQLTPFHSLFSFPTPIAPFNP